MNTVYVVMIRVGKFREIASIFDSKSKAEHYIQEYSKYLENAILQIDVWRVK